MSRSGTSGSGGETAYERLKDAHEELDAAKELLQSSGSDMALDLVPILDRVDPSFALSGPSGSGGEAFDSSRPWMVPLSDFADYSPSLNVPREDDDIEIEEDRDESEPRALLQKHALHALALDISLSRLVFTNARPVHPSAAPQDWHQNPDETPMEGVEDELARATGGLSLASQPTQGEGGTAGEKGARLPRERTGFLRPKWASKDAVPTTKSSTKKKTAPTKKGKEKQKAPGHSDSDSNPDGSSSKIQRGFAKIKPGGAEQPLGVRALLSEWVVGEDPEDFVFTPYGVTKGESTPGERSQSRGRTHHSSAPPVRPQTAASATQPPAGRPPIVGSTSAPRIATSTSNTRVPVASSSSQPSLPTNIGARPVGSSNTQIPSQSQTLSQSQSQGQSQALAGANTQVEPGRFGGRPPALGAGGAGKKAVVKKKKAGF